MVRARVGARVGRLGAASTRAVLVVVSAALLLAAGAGGATAQAPRLRHVGTIPGSADVLAVVGDLLIAGTRNEARILDVSQPGAASVAGRYAFGQPVLDIAVGKGDGPIVYVANSHDGLRRLDLSDPAAPVVSGTLPTRGQAVGVAVASGYAFVGDNSLGFDSVELAGGMQRVGEYLGDGFPRDIAAMGTLVFVADQPAGLLAVDVSDPASPSVAGRLSLGREPVTGVVAPDARSWDAEPSFVAMASGTAGLQVVDVSDPTAPTTAASIAPAGRFAGVAIWADRLFVAGDCVLRVFDLAEPGLPVLVAEADLGGEAGTVAVGEEHVFAATADGIRIFRRP